MDQEIRKGLAPSASGYPGIRAAVIVPSVCDFYFTPHRFSCLGAHSVCNILSELEIQHVLFNFPLMDKKPQLIDIPDDIGYLRKQMLAGETGRLSYFTKYQRFGPETKQCARLVADSRPSLCLISCFAFSYAQEAIDLAKDIKELLPGVTIVVGGAGVSAYPIYFIRDTHVDFALAGEAEIGLKPFCNALLDKELNLESVPNLYRNGDSPSQIRALRYTCGDEINPVVEKVQEKRDLTCLSVSLTRGCNKNCRFCSNFLCHGHGFRKALLQSVSSTINRLSIDGKSRVLVNFEDDNLLFEPDYLLQIMGLFQHKCGNAAFLAENGLDYTLLTPALADQLIDAGMSKFNFTLASVDRHVLDGQHRKGSQTHFESIVRHIASRGIPVLSYFICGLKGDTKESVADVLAYLYSLPTQIGISLFYAIPGLPDFSNLEQFDKLSPHLCNGTSAYPWYGKDGLETVNLVTAFRLSRYINLLKAGLKSDIEMQSIEKIQKERKLFTLIKGQKQTEIVPVPHTDDELVSLVLGKITP
jgi:anaerobic magnesium-protoporphyrin IX monomethyl ester cyclase